uniref:S1 motif domain-containing protein n=1 Tax=Timema genevievae TaxID=629358 RepID=A0A7R9K3J2_TIMGE|nr:unnamed protein product [Timema genevievae]
MRRTPLHTGEQTKRQSKYRGPLVMLKVFPDGNTYRVSQLTGDVKQKHYATTAHVSQSKSWGNKTRLMMVNLTEFNTSNRFIEMCGLDLKKIGTKEFIQRIEEYVQNYGQVKNVTTFAAFVDCGLEVDGFIPAKYINTINICVGDRVEVKSQLELCEYSYSELQAELVA